jgi:hypothetical protein
MSSKKKHPRTPLEEILNVVESTNDIVSEQSEQLDEILHVLNKMLDEMMKD